jgi:hypothetical protein
MSDVDVDDIDLLDTLLEPLDDDDHVGGGKLDSALLWSYPMQEDGSRGNPGTPYIFQAQRFFRLVLRRRPKSPL